MPNFIFLLEEEKASDGVLNNTLTVGDIQFNRVTSNLGQNSEACNFKTSTRDIEALLPIKDTKN